MIKRPAALSSEPIYQEVEGISLPIKLTFEKPEFIKNNTMRQHSRIIFSSFVSKISFFPRLFSCI